MVISIMPSIDQIISTIDTWLKPSVYRDYCPNGLQVEGKDTAIRSIACAVTASQYTIEAAIQAKANLLLVHHGFFWKGESPVLTGAKRKRIETLLNNGVHLVAYHLPLDGHDTLGNNAQLALKLGLELEKRVPDKPDSLLYVGRSKEATTGQQLCTTITEQLHRKPIFIGNPNTQLHSIAWCTGGAQSFFAQAIAAGVDCFITGEVSEQNYHQANESGVCFIAAGHHATERYGVQALGTQLATSFQLDYCFIDENNPV